MKAGTLLTGTGKQAHSDTGLGLMLRYRPIDALGLQLDVAHHSSEFWLQGDRQQTLGSASGALFLSPRAAVSPYLLGGMTLDGRNLSETDLTDGSSAFENGTALYGGHGGLGLQLGLGDNAAIDLEGRYIGWMNPTPQDRPTAWVANAGVTFKF